MCKNKEINQKIDETKQKVGVFRFGRVSGSGFGSGFGSGSEPETRPKIFAKPEPEPKTKFATRNSTNRHYDLFLGGANLNRL